MPAAEPVSQKSPLQQPVTTLWGIGSERAELLKRLEIRTVEDLLLHRPRRYEDRRQVRSVKELRLGELAVVRGPIVAMGVKWFQRHSKSIFELIIDDGTGRLCCRWWNVPFMEKNFEKGQEAVLCGKPKNLKPRIMEHPEVEVVETGEEASIHLNRITPIYPLTEGLSQRWLRGLMWRTIERFAPHIPDPAGTEVLQVVGGPGTTLALRNGRWPSTLTGLAAGLPSRANAVRMIHFPEHEGDPDIARQRLALDEFLELQLRIQNRRKNFETKSRGLPCRGDNRLIKPFLTQLGFRLTASQTKVLRELRSDMSAAHPMRRLLQGDVGSGKTVVAACCALMALESGFDVALMAPTEILAEQHFANFSKWFAPLDVEVQLRTGTHKSSNGRTPTPNVAYTTRNSLFIGTHALVQSGFQPEKLGLVVIDEQHRFGVAQREELVRKGNYPHLLVMTATPIPRTLGLTLYGDLDVSVIDSPPAGRGKMRTFIRRADKLPQVWTFIRQQLAVGRQAYVVYPRVEETGENGIKAVAKEFATLQRAFSPHRVGLVHGRLKSEEKEEVMNDFRANRLQVLLATSLIEVGVDVPNATVMLIENAERFGLAQLHQLRGRIGRGAHESYCILVAAANTREAQARLKVLEETSDGFEIAEADLRLRGPGDLLGQQQSGLPTLRFGDLAADLELVKTAREIAVKVRRQI
jgi:ATP-dependent DNA helicase RecG